MPNDVWGRSLQYLRLSLTDQCNLHCLYCRPARPPPPSANLTPAEILRLARLCVELGFSKIRLTGGEPTLYPQLIDMVRGLAALPGLRQLGLTTNGTRLRALAQPLAEAGLRSVNISLDAVNAAVFKRLTGGGQIEPVWAGIQAAEQAGLQPIKINAVVVRGYNEAELPALAALTREHAWQVRFIELMPLGAAAADWAAHQVSAAEMRARLEAALGPLLPLTPAPTDGVAQLYQLPAGRGTLGFIPAVSQPFCANCTRARLTADGRLRLCLLQPAETDLLTPLRRGATEAELRALIQYALWHKPAGQTMADASPPTDRPMSQLGG